VFRTLSKPIRTVLRWQVAATALVALLAAYWVGIHGAVSALLGGAVSTLSGLAFAAVASLSKTKTLEGTLVGALRAESAKIGVIVVLLWLVFVVYKDIVAVAFIGTFAVTVIIFSMAFFVRDVDPNGA
jgi:ATP synthase protein I